MDDFLFGRRPGGRRKSVRKKTKANHVRVKVELPTDHSFIQCMLLFPSLPPTCIFSLSSCSPSSYIFLLFPDYSASSGHRPAIIAYLETPGSISKAMRSCRTLLPILLITWHRMMKPWLLYLILWLRPRRGYISPAEVSVEE